MRAWKNAMGESETMDKTWKILQASRIRGTLRDHADLEDSFQETCLAVLLNQRSDKKCWQPSKGRFSTWDFSIHKNKATDRIRKNYSRTNALTGYKRQLIQKSEHLHETNSQVNKLLKMELYEKMHQKLEKYGKPRLVEIFLLMADNLNGKQISKILGFSQGQISKDKKLIRKILKQYKPSA